MTPLYELAQVRQAYKGRTVLHIEGLALAKGEVTGLRGENGSGKSTLLRILALLEDPLEGRVIYEGKAVTSGNREARLSVTLLPQEPYLLKRSVRANVAYGLKARGESHLTERVDQALTMVGLDPAEYGPRPWYALSGGEAQRTALASRLALRPKVLLLDEPTNSLDEDSEQLIREAALAARRDWGTTLVVVSHDRKWLDNICNRIVGLKQGRMILDSAAP